MSKSHHLKTRKTSAVTKAFPLNFLLGCSQSVLQEFQLARLAEVANLRKELQVILDRMMDEMSAAALAQWFLKNDRNALKHAIENEESPVEWAKRMIRNEGRSEEEIGEDGYLIPLPSLPPGAAHLAAAARYQNRNMAQGKCRSCPNPLAHGSVQYCEEHLAKSRVRQRQKKGLQDVGSREYLYAGDITEEQTHGRQPGTLASLEMNREKKTRAALAELGIPPESAAVTLNAAKEVLMQHMPIRRGHALAQQELFDLAVIPSKTTGGKALNELLSEQKIDRIGKGINGDPYRYFLRADS